MKLTIGMACYDDFDGVYFTINSILQYHREVIDDIRPTKYDINDDDFLIDSIDVINFSDAETWLSEHESFRVLFNALKNLGVGDINSSSFENSKSEEKDLVLFSGDKFDEEFQNEWA